MQPYAGRGGRVRRKLGTALSRLNALVQRHGGGWTGLKSVVSRAWKMARVLGVAGVMRRFEGATISERQPPAPTGYTFPPPVPLVGHDLRVGIMAHMFYADLANEFARYFTSIPVPYTLLVSVVDQAAAEACHKAFSQLPNLEDLQVRLVPNRGRDIAPFLVEFRDEVRKLDLVAHVHTKKSLYTGSEQSGWRTYLLESLLGQGDRIEWILGTFLACPALGIVYPETYSALPLWAHTWLGNRQVGQQLAHRMGFDVGDTRYFDYPAGSMFWARTTSLAPLLELGLKVDDFPEEMGQTDGTMQHAVERLLTLTARNAGFVAGILPGSGVLVLSDEGGRNWRSYFSASPDARLEVASLEADLISTDLFDTLVTRPFLYQSGMRDFIAERAAKALGIEDFTALRSRAETLARLRAERDVNLHEIYDAMGTLPDAPAPESVERLKALELASEKTLLRTRPALEHALKKLTARGKRVVAVSDMYLDQAQLREVLPGPVLELPEKWYVSCETQLRKDEASAWKVLPSMEGVPRTRWLHVGDNEHADLQIPQDLGYMTPVHVLRPDALLDVVPALRPLRPPHGAATHWHQQLLLGLMARRLADLADQSPEGFLDGLAIPDPQTLGYLVLGPLVADYTLWLTRLAAEQGTTQILFLAREGHLLHQAFDIVQAKGTGAPQIRGDYLLASRRGIGMASVRTAEDFGELLSGTFTGSLDALLKHRMGTGAATAVQDVLGAAALRGPVFLPEMRAQLLDTLAPASEALLEVARDEREKYLTYWEKTAEPQGDLLLADLGYAGTIQKFLSRLTGRSLDGAYFAVNSRIDQLTQTPLRAWARYEDPRVSTDRSQVTRYDMLLEALLTSPQGQFLRFDLDPTGMLISTHATHELGEPALHDLQRIHEGALTFVRDVCEAAGELAWSIEFDPALVQVPLRCLGEGRWKPGSWFSRLGIEDGYTGRGLVAAEEQTNQRINAP